MARPLRRSRIAVILALFFAAPFVAHAAAEPLVNVIPAPLSVMPASNAAPVAVSDGRDDLRATR